MTTTGTSLLTFAWRESFKIAAFAMFVSLAVFSFISESFGVGLGAGAIVWLLFATVLMLADGLHRAFRKLTGLRIRIVIERVR